MSDIFISYSRQDSAFVEQLRTALVAQKHSVWVDTSNILPASHWRQEIIDAIEAAGVVLFILSPDWVASEVSQRELQYAVTMQKKIVPIVYRDVDHKVINPALAELNWIFARATDNPVQSFQQILFAIDTDLDFWSAGSDLLVKARQWEQGNRRSAYTLRGEPLRRAEQWLASSANKRPGPNALQIEYITAGRRSAAARQRITIGALTFGIAITLVASIIATVLDFRLNEANGHLNAGNIAGKANALALNYQYDQALLVAAEANRLDDTSQTRSTLYNVMNSIPYVDTLVDTNRATNASRTVNDTSKKVSYSADGKMLLYATASQLTVWDTTTNAAIRHFNTQSLLDDYSDALLSPNGKVIAIASSLNSKINFIDAVTGQSIGTSTSIIDDYVNEIQYADHWAFSPDSTLLAWEACHSTDCQQRSIFIYDVATHDLQRELLFDSWHTDSLNIDTRVSITFSPDGKRLFGTICKKDPLEACSQSKISIWDTTTFGKPQTITPPDTDTQFDSVAISPDGNTLAIGGSFSVCSTAKLGCTFAFIAIYDAHTIKFINGTLEPRTDGIAGAQYVTFSGDGRSIIAKIGFRHIGIFPSDFHDNNINDPWLTSFETHDLIDNIIPSSSLTAGEFTDLVSCPTGHTFATADLQGNIVIWDAYSHEVQAQHTFFTTNPSPVLTLNSTTALTITDDGTLTSWNVQNGQRGSSITTGLAGTHTVLATSSDGTLVALGDKQGEIHVISLPDGHIVGKMMTDGSSYPITRIAMSPDKHYLAASIGMTTTLFDIQTAEIIFQSTSDTTSFFPLGIAFVPNDHILAYATSKQAIDLYDLSQKKVITTIKNIPGQTTAIAFNAAGTQLAAYTDKGGVYIINRSDANTLQTVRFALSNDSSSKVTSVQFVKGVNTHSEELFIIGDDTIGLWDIQNKRYDMPVQHYDKSVYSASLIDNKLVISLEDHIFVQSVTGPSLQTAAHRIAARDLSSAEYNEFIKNT
jgi:WD40 repeat protein